MAEENKIADAITRPEKSGMEAYLEWVFRWGPCLVPVLACVSFLAARVVHDQRAMRVAEAVYFAGFFLVAIATLHTVTSDNDCWLMHTASLGLMVIGAVVCRPDPSPETSF